MFSLQSELQCLYSTQQAELQAERDLSRTLQEKCRHLEESLKRLQDEAEVSLREVYLESQQITENMDEDHRGLCSKSESFNGQAEPQKLTELSQEGRRQHMVHFSSGDCLLGFLSGSPVTRCVETH